MRANLLSSQIGLESFLPFAANVKASLHRRPVALKSRRVICIVGFLAAVNALAGGTTGPIIKRIYFEPVVIKNIEVKSPTYPIDEPKLRLELAAQFNTWIVRSITKKDLAIEAKAIESLTVAQDDLVLKSTLDIPLTHQADMSHWSNQFRRGTFMEYHLTLTRPDGVVVAKVTGGLTWGDGFWSQSRAKGRPTDQSHNEVMRGYVRKAVDRGVESLKKALNSGSNAAGARSIQHPAASSVNSPAGERGPL